jgi:hypothetical protein
MPGTQASDKAPFSSLYRSNKYLPTVVKERAAWLSWAYEIYETLVSRFGAT